MVRLVVRYMFMALAVSTVCKKVYGNIAISRNSPLAIVTLSVGEGRSALTKCTLRSLESYTAKHGYGFFSFSESLDTTRHPSWSKIPALLAVMRDYHYDWVVWIDDDICITDMSKKFETFIAEHEKVDIIMSYDALKGYTHKELPVLPEDESIFFNAGFFLVKNSAWSRDFLQMVYQHYRPTMYLWEQTSMLELYRQNSEICDHFALLPVRHLQSFFIGDQAMRWQPGDFAAHVAMLPLQEKVATAQRIMRLLGLS